MTWQRGTRSDPRAELARLEASLRQLAAALADLQHEMRRYDDRLERVGGQSYDLERQVGVLQENRAQIQADLARTRRNIGRLRAELGIATTQSDGCPSNDRAMVARGARSDNHGDGGDSDDHDAGC